jgi:hypothetical protein
MRISAELFSWLRSEGALSSSNGRASDNVSIELSPVASEAVMSGGIVAKLLEGRLQREGRLGREELPRDELHALSHVSDRNAANVAPAEKLYAWNMLTPMLARVGVRLSADDRTLITAGDEDVAAFVLSELRERLAPSGQGRAESNSRQASERAPALQQLQQLQQVRQLQPTPPPPPQQQQQPTPPQPPPQPQMRHPLQAEAPSHRATPLSSGAEERYQGGGYGERAPLPARPRAPPPEWRSCLARMLQQGGGLSAEDAAEATGGEACEVLRAMLMQAPGRRPAVAWGAGGAHGFLEAVASGAGELVRAAGREADEAASAAAWGMFARERAVVLWSFRAAAAIAAERRVADGGSDARTAAWLLGEWRGAGGAAPIDGVVAGVRQHPDTVVGALAVLEHATETRLGAVVSGELCDAAARPGGAAGQDAAAGVGVVAVLVEGLRLAPRARATLVRQGGVGPLLRRAVDEARAGGAAEPRAAEARRCGGLALIGAAWAEFVPEARELGATSDLWAALRAAMLGGAGSSGAAQLAAHEALLAVMRGCIFHKSPDAAVAYKLAVSSLLDHYSVSALRARLATLLGGVLRENPRMPLGILVEPLMKHAAEAGVAPADFELHAALARHPRLERAHALMMLDAMARVSFAGGSCSKEASACLLHLLARFRDVPPQQTPLPRTPKAGGVAPAPRAVHNPRATRGQVPLVLDFVQRLATLALALASATPDNAPAPAPAPAGAGAPPGTPAPLAVPARLAILRTLGSVAHLGHRPYLAPLRAAAAAAAAAPAAAACDPAVAHQLRALLAQVNFLLKSGSAFWP